MSNESDVKLRQCSYKQTSLYIWIIDSDQFLNNSKQIGSKREPTGSETGEDVLSLSSSRQQLLRCTSGIFIVSCVTSQTGFTCMQAIQNSSHVYLANHRISMAIYCIVNRVSHLEISVVSSVISLQEIFLATCYFILPGMSFEITQAHS